MKFLLVLEVMALLWSFKVNAGLTPDWFSDFEKAIPGCDQNLLCVSGEGSTLNEALAMGRDEMAKFFKTKIQSKSEIATASEQKGVLSQNTNLEEWTSKSIREEADEVLSGLEVKKQEVKDGRYFVVLALTKSILEKELREKIEGLDWENSKNLELNSRFSYPKILKNINVIEAFTDRYRLISAHPLTQKVNKAQIIERLQKLKPMKVLLVTKGKKLPLNLSHTLIDLLTPLKITLVDRASNTQLNLITELKIEEQYLKIAGFKKLNINLRLELRNAQNKILGKMSALSEQTGRSILQAVDLSIPELKEYLVIHLDELSTQKFED